MSEKNIAIVTGASGGMGREFVRLLSLESGIDEIWAVARGAESLSLLCEQFGERVRPVPIDLSDRKDTARLGEMLSEEGPRVSYLVNNAGFAKFCSYAELSAEESLNMIDLNIGAVVSVGLTVLPYMVRGGRILNIASQASFQPLPYMNLYSATKAFVRNYTRALNVELRERGISATAVCPGWMKTGLFARGEVGAKKAPSHFPGIVLPGPVAEKALRDAKKGKDCSVYGGMVKFAHAAAKILPQRWMMRFWLLQQKIR